MTGEPSSGYRAALRDRVVRTLWLATASSSIGDYVGQGAMLLLAYDRSGDRVLGSAAILAFGALPALLTGVLAGGPLDRLPRGRALIGLHLVGAVAIALPVVIPGLPIVFLAAALLGAVRAGTAAVRSGAMADAVPDQHRGPLLALMSSTDQTSQVFGYLAGASMAALVGAESALLVDAASFLIGALLLTRLSFPPPRPRDRKPRPSEGMRDILGNPVLRFLGPLVWVSAAVSALPEALASGVAEQGDPLLPFVFAAAPAGQALTMLVVGRLPQMGKPSAQLIHLAWLSLAFGIAAQGRSPAWFVLANFLVGSGVAWSVGPQLAFVRLAPPERMAQITGTMIAVLITAEGLGAPLLAWLADQTSVATAYRVAGFLVLAAAVIGWVVKDRTTEAHLLDEDPTGALVRDRGT